MQVMHNSLEEARIQMKLLLFEGNLCQWSMGHRPLLFILPNPTASILTAQEAEQAGAPASRASELGVGVPLWAGRTLRNTQETAANVTLHSGTKKQVV